MKKISAPSTERAVELPPIGTWWRENHAQPGAPKKVVSHGSDGRVGLQTESGRLTYAKAERFNGKRSGYSRYFMPNASQK